MTALLMALLTAQDGDLLYVQAGEGLKGFAVRDGALSPATSLATPGFSPSYLRASGRRLYAAGNDRLQVFEIGPGGALTRVADAPSPGGPCYVDVHPAGRWASTANYGSGSTLLYPLEGGAPREPASFGTGAQSHSARFDPAGRFLYALSVKERRITRLPLDGGAPWALELPGLGPRHIAFSRDGALAFVVHERPIRVSSLKVDAEGRLEHLGDVPALPEGVEEKKDFAAAEIAASGRFVYASLRDFSKDAAQNGLAVFRVEDSGALRRAGFTPSGGVSPRGFVIAGAFVYVLNEIPGTLRVFRADPASGLLRPASEALPLGGRAIGIAWVNGS